MSTAADNQNGFTLTPFCCDTMILVMILGAMCSYVLARFQFPGRRAIYYLMLAGLTFPPMLAIVPLFFVLRNFGMLNTLGGLTITYVAFALPFTVFFLYSFFKSLPYEVAEAAAIDGAGEWKTFFLVMLPMARPARPAEVTGPAGTLRRVGTFAGIVIVAMIVLVVVAIFGTIANRQKRQERQQQIRRLATGRGWQFIERDDSYGRRWKGAPFSNRGDSSNIVIGQHRGRNFCCFQYHYTTVSSNGKTSTAQAHYYTIHVIALPAPVPDLSVGAEGIFGGKVAEAFGFARVEINDPDFNNTFKVKSDDQAFGSLVLQPAVVDRLKATGPWDWRFSGQDMISYQTGILEPATVQPRLDLMCDLLDRMPNDLWRRPQLPH